MRATADSLRTSICDLNETPTTRDELEQAEADTVRLEHIARGIPRDISMDLLTSDAVPHARMAHMKVRRWKGAVPLGAICRAGKCLTCSPEFCFVLIACDIGRVCQEKLKRWQHVVVLAELGCELCGTYSKQDDKRGFKSRRMPLVSMCQMRDFACALAHERGAALAYESLRWVIDGLNSPMETVVYLMLCLPNTCGGLALFRPRANWSIPVPEKLWKKTTRRHVVPDLYWPEQRLAAEFFGKDFHEGHEHDDMERLEIEQDMGLKVVTFWKEDVLDLERFNAKAASVARYLGIELPEADNEFKKLQSTLQQMLVKHQRWV